MTRGTCASCSLYSYALITCVILMASTVHAEPPDRSGLTPAKPIRCSGNEDIELVNRIIETSAEAVIADRNCDVEIMNSHIISDGVAIVVQGNADVEILNSVVRGKKAAILARDNADVEYTNSTIDGDIQIMHQATVESLGGRRVSGERQSGTSIDLSGLASIGVQSRDQDDDSSSVKIGPSGVVVKDEEGNRVGIDDDVTVDSGTEDTSVTIDDGWMRIESDTESVDISGDWRMHADSRYSSSDTRNILMELDTSRQGDELNVRLAGDVLFDFDSTQIRPDAATELAKVAHLLRERATGEIKVIGHSDSKGSDEYNMKLSRDRAISVMRWLNEKEGIPMALMIARGRGATKPIAHNTMPDGSDNPEGRAKNRRVEIQFVTSE